jgi:hypothetical protein
MLDEWWICEGQIWVETSTDAWQTAKKTLIHGIDHLWDPFIMETRHENQVLCNEPTMSLVAQNFFFLRGEWCVVYP